MPTTVSGNWRYFRVGQYMYGWSTQPQYHSGISGKYVSFVRRWHKTKNQYVTVESKTATHASRVKAKNRAARLAGFDVPKKTAKPKSKNVVPNDHGYCLSCREVRQIDNLVTKEQVTKNGKVRHAITGNCSDCNTKIFKYVSNKQECPGCFEQKSASDFPEGFPYTCSSCRQ